MHPGSSPGPPDRPRYVVVVEALPSHPAPPDRRVAMWLKNGLRAHSLRALFAVEAQPGAQGPADLGRHAKDLVGQLEAARQEIARLKDLLAQPQGTENRR